MSFALVDKRLQGLTRDILNIVADKMDSWQIRLEGLGRIGIVVKSEDDVHPRVSKASRGPTAS
jgi:hypothetical protein